MIATNTYRERNVSTPNTTHPTRLTPHQVKEKRAKGLYFNYVNKYNKGHKCNEKKLFYIDNEEEDDPELKQS